MDNYNFNFGGDGDETEDGDTNWDYGGRGATVYLIDAANEMFIKSDESDDTPFIIAIKCVHASVCRHVISSDQDLTAVVLYNTGLSVSKKSKTGGSSTAAAHTFPHVAVLQVLERPSADRVMQLETFIKDSKTAVVSEFDAPCEDASISDALWAASNLITQCKSRLSGQSVVLFTCRAAPHTSDHLKKQAVCKAKDLDDAGIDLELLSLGPKFDHDAFYKNVLTLGGEAPDRAPAPSSALRLEELQDRVRRTEHKQRTTGRVSMTLAAGLEISVGLYTAHRKTLKPYKQKLYKGGNEEVRAITKEYLDTGELLMSSDFAKYQIYGNKKIMFTEEETRTLRKVYPTGIELLGFKPRSTIKAYQYVRPASFMYPDEENVKGSHSVFAGLLQRCVAKGVVPIVRVVPRVNSAPLWAALLPQEEVLSDDDQSQVQPPGFHVCYLPFGDDIRHLEEQVRERAAPEQVDRAKEFITKLHFRYDSLSFDDPDLQTHWRNVEALALNRAELEPVQDYTVPDYARIRKKTGDLVTALKDSVWPNGYDVAAAARKPAPKKPAGGSKLAAPKQAAGPQSVEDMIKNNTVEKLTMPVLKSWLESKGIRTQGKKKAQLVEDVYDAV